MKNFLLNAAIGAAALGVINLSAAPVNPYVELYRTRTDSARAFLAKGKVQVDYDQILRDRTATLYRRNAASLQEYQESIRKYESSVADLKVLEARVAEADVTLQLAKFRTDTGLDMPICNQ